MAWEKETKSLADSHHAPGWSGSASTFSLLTTLAALFLPFVIEFILQ